MSDLREGPFFNLKAVIKQTGLKPDTLRAWERRYGIPSPERSAGGHRLYSQRDISTVKWLMARQQEGMSIKRAVELWRQIEKEGRDPLRSPAPLATESAPALAPQIADGTVSDLRRAWIDACLAYDESSAEQVLAQAFALYSPEVVCLELLQKAVAAIGAGWYEGRVTVQQEHFCSALAIRRVEALVMAAPPPTRPGRILAACPPEEQHVFGLLLLTLLLRRRGWQVVYLGANVPVERLETAVAAVHPHVVILAAQQLHSAATLLDAAGLLQREDVPLAYGGLVFNLLPELRQRIPGHFLGEQLEPALQVAESLLTTPRPLPQGVPAPAACRQARAHFESRQHLVEARVSEAFGEDGILGRYLALANHELGVNIDAALHLGDMAYVGSDIDWLAGLLRNHHVPAEALRRYLTAYLQAARSQLDERGRPIVDWLERMVHGQQLDGSGEGGI
jgi:DNA-binding transcriptional MerR regulator/methylmalonyl-CoA mutase cobalamin-binding subunit